MGQASKGQESFGGKIWSWGLEGAYKALLGAQSSDGETEPREVTHVSEVAGA